MGIASCAPGFKVASAPAQSAKATASAKLAGAKTVLSFDSKLKALAVAEGLEVFPPLDAAGKTILARLKQSA